jgi:hypothetical protein
MSKAGHFTHHSDDDLIDCAGPDGISTVLAALQKLTEHCRHPVVRTCLEQAYEDIVHLASDGDPPQDYDDEFGVVAD